MKGKREKENKRRDGALFPHVYTSSIIIPDIQTRHINL